MNNPVKNSIKDKLHIHLKDKQGVTMIELVITIVLIGIFATGICQIMSSTILTYHKLRDTQTAVQVSDTLLDKIVGEIESAQPQDRVTNDTNSITISDIDENNNKIELKDWASNQISISSSEGYLLIHYDELKDKNDKVLICENDWKFDQKMYMGFYIKSLKFDFPGEPDGYVSYGKDVVHVLLTLENSKGISYTAERYTGCYNLADNSPFANDDLKPSEIVEEPTPIDGVALVYYEYIQGDTTLYYHGYNQDGEEVRSAKPLVTEHGKYVSEAGYMLVFSDNAPPSRTDSIIETDAKMNLNNSTNKTIDLKEINCTGFVLSKFYVNNTWYFMTGAAKISVVHNSKTYIFNMTPYFADSVNTKDYTYYVRTPEQLYSCAKNDGNYLSNSNITIKQTLDIDCKNNNTSLNGIAGEYVVAGGYVIKNLNKVFIEQMNLTGRVDGVTLVNSYITDSSSKAIFINNNYGGIIKNCCVRPDKAATDGYSKCKINTGGDVAGFVDHNGGKIEDCFVSATVESDSGNASGFVQNNNNDNATISNCYSNSIVTGNNAYGFAGGTCGKVSNCHVLGCVTAKNGIAYGFAQKMNNDKDVENSYVALCELSGKQGVQQFATGNNNTDKATNSFYMKPINSAESMNYDVATEILYAKLKSNETRKTYKYNSNLSNLDNINITYPFSKEIGSSLEIWGDWPKEP